MTVNSFVFQILALLTWLCYYKSMQRLRTTESGLQFTDGVDIVSFSPVAENRGIRVGFRQSKLNEGDPDIGLLTVEGRDNIGDFAQWLIDIEAKGAENEGERVGSFDGYTVGPQETVSAVSDYVDNSERAVRYSALLDALDEWMGSPPMRPRDLDIQAFAHPLGIPEGMMPLMITKQTHDRLTIQLGAETHSRPLPLKSLQRFGRWTIDGLATIKKPASTWGKTAK